MTSHRPFDLMLGYNTSRTQENKTEQNLHCIDDVRYKNVEQYKKL